MMINFKDVRGWDEKENSYGKRFLRRAHNELLDTGVLGGHMEWPNGCSVLFAHNGTPTKGNIIACMVYTYAHDLNGIYIHTAFVDYGYREQGVFVSMLEVIKDRARTLDIPNVYWEVLAGNDDMHAISEKLAEPVTTRYSVDT